MVDAGTWFLPDGAAPEDEPLIDVRLRDLPPPEPGVILLSAESAPIGGRVVSAEQDGGEVAVRLQSVPLPDLFARYDIDCELPLADYDIEEQDEEASALELTRPVLPEEHKLIDKKFPQKGAFQCSASVTAFLEKNTVDLRLNGDASFIFKSSRFDDSQPPGYLKVAIEGPLTLVGSLALKAKAGLKAKGKCELKGRIPIALGAFAIIVSPAIPLGVGVSIDAKLTAVSMELGFQGENGFDLGMGPSRSAAR